MFLEVGGAEAGRGRVAESQKTVIIMVDKVEYCLFNLL